MITETKNALPPHLRQFVDLMKAQRAANDPRELERLLAAKDFDGLMEFYVRARVTTRAYLASLVHLVDDEPTDRGEATK